MTTSVDVDDALLRGWPLPVSAPDADKEERGRVLIVGGSAQVPGAAVLAGLAALRAGAGKLAIATPRSAHAIVAAALPEARVIPLDESAGGAPLPESAEQLRRLAGRASAVLVGPGMMDTKTLVSFVEALLPMAPRAALLLDAAAMDAIIGRGAFDQPVLLTPHAGEMAHLTGMRKEAICDDPMAVAQRIAGERNAMVALKGATTCIAHPDGRAWCHRGGTAGLGTSGSGDVLAGIIAGLAARGAPMEQAVVWGVALHARAGARLAERVGTLGFIARELPAEIPALMERLK